MHKKYAAQGLVCMSVSVDVPEQRAAALKFLTRQDATFANYLLEERTSFWQDKFGLNGPPAVFVFNREGKWKRFDHDEKPYTYADVEQLVQQWLK